MADYNTLPPPDFSGGNPVSSRQATFQPTNRFANYNTSRSTRSSKRSHKTTQHRQNSAVATIEARQIRLARCRDLVNTRPVYSSRQLPPPPVDDEYYYDDELVPYEDDNYYEWL